MTVAERNQRVIECREHGCLPVEQWSAKIGSGMDQTCYQCANCGAAWTVQRIECTSCGEGPTHV